MTTADLELKQEDFIGQLLRLIRQGDKAQALEKILKLSDRVKLDTLDTLISEVYEVPYFHFYLSIAKVFYWAKASNRNRLLDRAHAISRDLFFSLGRARAISRDLSFSLSLDRAQTLEREFSHAHALALSHMLYRDLAFERAFSSDSRLHTGIQDLALSVDILVFLAEYALPQEMIEDASSRYYQRLADALDEILSFQQKQASDILDVVTQVLEVLLGKGPLYITLEGVNSITPDIMTNQIGPYLQALSEYLRIYAELTDTPFNELSVVQIHNVLPKLEVLNALVNPLIKLLQFFVPRGDDQKARTTDLNANKLSNQIIQRKNEQEFAQMESEKPNLSEETRTRLIKIQTEAQKSWVEGQQALLALEKEKYEFTRQKLQDHMSDAAKYVDDQAPNLSEEARLEYIIRFAVTFKQMSDTGLTLHFGSHDSPRSPMFPESPKPPDEK